MITTDPSRTNSECRTCNSTDGVLIIFFGQEGTRGGTAVQLCTTCRARLAHVVAPPAPATVGAFLAVVAVAEFQFEESWWQIRPGGHARSWRGVRWGSWWSGGFDDDDLRARPCRLVPMADAESDPAVRGPL